MRGHVGWGEETGKGVDAGRTSGGRWTRGECVWTEVSPGGTVVPKEDKLEG